MSKKKRIKWDIKKVRKLFKDGGCELLEEEYINNGTKMKYICICERPAEICLTHFIGGKRCKKCAIERRAAIFRLSYKEVKEIFRKGGCTLISKEYKNSRELLDYQCSCTRFAKISLSNFKKGQRCKKCAIERNIERNAEKRRKTIKEVKEIFKKGGCELLEYIYIDSHIKMKFLCDCEREAEITLHSFQMGHRCMKCAIEERAEQLRYSYKEVKEIFRKGGCTLISKEYKGSGYKLEYLCDCGRPAEIRFTDFQSGQRCIECAIERRSGENHYNYNPNLTDEERIIGRNYKEYVEWRTKVYKRDDYTCHINGEKGVYLIAHHLESYDVNIDLRLVVLNGITMSKELHTLFHNIYGYGNNTTAQFKEFQKNYQQNLLNIEV